MGQYLKYSQIGLIFSILKFDWSVVDYYQFVFCNTSFDPSFIYKMGLF